MWLFLLWAPAPGAAAQNASHRSDEQAVAVAAATPHEATGHEARFKAHDRTLGISWGWGHSWQVGGTRSNIAFGTVLPQMGWFVTNRLEMYGEATFVTFHEPETEIGGGGLILAGRYHFWNDRSWTPYFTLGSGIFLTNLDVEEIDRTFNFQVTTGFGVRFAPRSRVGWLVEVRNLHISNAGTAGRNIGINAITALVGLQWILH